MLQSKTQRRRRSIIALTLVIALCVAGIVPARATTATTSGSPIITNVRLNLPSAGKMGSALGVVAIGAATTVAFALTPVNGGSVGGSTIEVDNTGGDQVDPHVSGHFAAYTDASDPSGQALIRYYDFLSPVSPNASIPTTPDYLDELSDVNGNHIAFARLNFLTGSRACMVYNVVSGTTVQIGSASQVRATALGSDTVAFVNGPSSAGDILAGRISNPSAPLSDVSASGDNNVRPVVSPAGNMIVWASCPAGTFTNCSIMKSTLSLGVWSAPAFVMNATADNPDTDGTNIVFDSGGDIFFQPADGGPATQLEIEGVQRNPSIAGGVIAFESDIDASAAADLFVYQIATNTLFRVTDTQFIAESFNDVTVLPNGDVRAVWAADDDVLPSARNIYARTFTLPSIPTYDFSGFFQPVDNLPTLNVASAGSSIPVKFSLSGDQGLSIFGAGYPKSSPIACDANEPGAFIEETVTAGNSSLNYDASTDLYSYIWKTDRGWRGTCRLLVVRFNDGSEHLAKFRFK